MFRDSFERLTSAFRIREATRSIQLPYQSSVALVLAPDATTYTLTFLRY